MINQKQLRDLIDRTLKEFEKHSIDAANLIQGTEKQESAGGRFIKQLGNGPALGIFQMEPNTHDDIWNNYLKYESELGIKVLELSGVSEAKAEHLEYNIKYGILMCRCHYLRKKGSIPSTVLGYAEYWKKHYNTTLGAGTVEEFVHNYNKYDK